MDILNTIFNQNLVLKLPYYSYTAKHLFYQSPTRHSDYTLTRQTVYVTVVNGDNTVDQLCSHPAAGIINSDYTVTVQSPCSPCAVYM